MSRRDRRELASSATMGGYKEKAAICEPGSGPHQTLAQLAPWPEASSLWNCGNKLLREPYRLWYLVVAAGMDMPLSWPLDARWLGEQPLTRNDLSSSYCH